MRRLLTAVLLASLFACVRATPPATSPAPAAPPAAAAASPAEAFLAGVHRTVLPNGLTVLTREQKGSGVVAINTWVKAGYFNEPDEVAGMAHLFEHMFFKGSQAYPAPEAIAQAVSSAGGSSNAGTIYDSTNYYIVLPKENFEKGVAIEADAIAHPLFDPKELKKEAEVVIEESNRKLDNPPAVAVERMLATSYTQHRIRRWRIGSNEVLRNIQRDNLMNFFETLYRPENIIVTVTGDVTPQAALAAVQRTFGEIPKGELRKGRGPVEPPQTEFRFGRSEADLKQGYSVFGWHTAGENSPDEETLQLLAALLGGGRSSRLYRAVVNPTGASSIDASHDTFADVGTFGITASFDEKNRAEVDRRIVAEVERMKQFGPTDYELAQARNAAEVGFLSGMESALGQAQALSQAESRGSYRDIATKLARLQGVTADDVRNAARKYLTTEKLTLYHYQPKGAVALGASDALQQVKSAAAQTVTAPEATPLPRLASSVGNAAASEPPQTFTLSNGATLVVQPRAGAPTVSAGIVFRGGRVQETASNAGVTRLMERMMQRGTATRSGEEIDRQTEFLGAQLQPFAMEDGFGIGFDTINRFFEPALDLLSDVVLNPTFPEAELTREKALQSAAIKRSLDSAMERPMQLYRAAMFPGHPYGLPELGTEESLQSLDRAALQSWWKQTVAADRALILVVGDVNAADVRRVVEARLASMQRSAGTTPTVAAAAMPSSPKENVEQRDKKQTAMILAFPVAQPSSADWPKFRLLQAVTSGLSGTFFAELRGRQSLAYTVFARPQAYATAGVFYGYLAAEATKEEAARKGLLTEMRKLQNEGVKPDDVERAKAFFAGATRIQRESNGALVSEYARDYVYGLPLDQVDRELAAVAALTPDDLREAAKKYLAGDNYVFAAVRGNPAK